MPIKIFVGGFGKQRVTSPRSKKKKRSLKNLSLPFQEKTECASDVSRSTGDEATRKVAGDAKATQPIFSLFPGMRSRYLQTPPLRNVRHPLARTHLYLAGLTGSGNFFFHYYYYYTSQVCLLIASCSRSAPIRLDSAFRSRRINTKTRARRHADSFRFSKHAWPRFQ